MTYNKELQEKLELLIKEHGYTFNELKVALLSLTKTYRESKSISVMIQKLVYCITRMPATYAAIHFVLSILLKTHTINSIVDIGSGPGTVFQVLKQLQLENIDIKCIEQDPDFINIAKKLGCDCEIIKGNARYHHLIPNAEWIIFSYSLNEMPESLQQTLIKKALAKASVGIIVIEPGTSIGCSNVRNIIDSLNGSGYVIAPCPHSNKCPLQNNKLCFFSTRLARSSAHRKIKEGSLGFENETFAYAIITKEPPKECFNRILGHSKRTNHILLKLCTPDGIKDSIASKKQKEYYPLVKNSSVGDSLPPIETFNNTTESE